MREKLAVRSVDGHAVTVPIMYGVHRDTINDIKRGKTWNI